VGLGRALLCVVVLWGEIATDIPRARLIKKQLLTIAKLPIYAARLATNQGFGGSSLFRREDQTVSVSASAYNRSDPSRT
jgi:hypothetical protein